MALSQLIAIAHGFNARLPETLRLMRCARDFVRSVSRSMYWFGWGTALIEGISSLGFFAAIGLALHNVSDNWYQTYLRPEQWSVVLVGGAIAVITLYRLGRELLGIAARWRSEIFDERVKLVIERQDIDILSRLDVGRLSDPEFILLQEKATQWEGHQSALRLYHTQRHLIGATAGLVASVSVIAALDPIFIVFAILPVGLEIVHEIWYDSKRRGVWEAMHLTRRVRDEYGHCLTRRRFLMQGKLFRFLDYWRSRYAEIRGNAWQQEQALEWWNVKWEAVLAAANVLTLAVVMAYLGGQLLSGSIAFSAVFFLWGSMQTIGTSLGRFSRSSTDIRKECINYAYREAFLSTQPLIEESGASRYSFPSTPTLELCNVSFRYPRTEALVLRGCTLSISPGEKVALIGENGSGKTTILRLLSKVYLPDDGVVRIDGLSTDRITQASWLEQLLFCTQDSDMPEFTIAETVTGSAPGTSDIARLERAALHSRAASVIDTLSDRYQTQIGADWPGGWEPSAGQWQRLKLTAAFYRLLESKVRIGLFDEPMSQCDMETRERFYRDLQSIVGKTIVVVAHDPAYLHFFKRVILIENGRVARDMRAPEEIAGYQREAIPQHDASSGPRLVQSTS